MARASRQPPLLRAFIAVLGCTGMAWGLVVLPSVWQHRSIERVAGEIVAGAAFRSETLSDQVAHMEAMPVPAWCRPSSLRSAAIVRLALWEQAFASAEPQLIDVNADRLRDAIVSALACSPVEPYLWLVLLSVESSRAGFDQRYLAYLRMSYRLGPNEGWIGRHRIRVAFAMLARLTPDLVDMAYAEFARLVANGFQREAADVFVGASEPVRQSLLARIANVTESRRREFAQMLHESGFDDVDVPGIARPGSRPWR